LNKRNVAALSQGPILCLHKNQAMKSIKNKYLFFLLRIIKDITKPNTWGISKDLKSAELGEYYFLFDEAAMENQKGGQKSIVYDEKGIPVNPTYVDVKDKAFVYFPITIGQVGLARFHTYLQSKTEENKKRFFDIVNWFMENYDESDELGVRWFTDVALPQYKNKGPWQSAFTQSRGISVLLRAYQLTQDKKYADIAERALIPFTKPVAEGGVTSFTPWGPYYEEYTSTVPTMVLNGKIFALCGVSDFTRVFPENKLAAKLFKEGIKTIENCLPEYDMGFWSRYNLCEADWYPNVDPATVTYQHLHITQLQMLYSLTGKEIFNTYVKKFKRQNTFTNALRMYFVKFRALKKLGRL
jgi:hypothetical protein